MTIQPTDLFLVSNAGSKKCEAQNLNGKTGNVLVNRGGVSHKTGIVNIPTTVRDDDLMLVNRGGASYKATGAEVQTLFPQGPAGGTDVITDVVDTEIYISGGWKAGIASNSVDFTYQYVAVCYGGGKYVGVGNSSNIYSDDGINWSRGDFDGLWTSITYGADVVNADGSTGLFVAAARGNPKIGYSTDGINWTFLELAAFSTTELRSITYGNGKFVAVANSGTNKALYSTNGVDWSAATQDHNLTWQGVAYGAGKFVAVSPQAANNPVMYSEDGDTWTRGVLAFNGTQIRCAAYGNNMFVALGAGYSAYSSDGITWQYKSTPGGLTYRSVTFSQGKFVAVSADNANPVGNQILHSVDGVTWFQASALSTNQSWYGITAGDDKFVAVGQNGTARAMYSYTGTDANIEESISDLTLASDKNLDTFTSGDGLKMVDTNGDTATYVPITSAITSATPGTLSGGWKETPTAASNNWVSIAYGKDKFVALATSGTVQAMYSIDGTSWSNIGVTGVPANNWSSVTYAPDIANADGSFGLFVAVGRNATGDQIIYSTDGIAWDNVDLTGLLISGIFWRAVTYGAGKFVALGGASLGVIQVMYSTDGINWSQDGVTGVPGVDWSSITYGNGVFVGVAESGSGDRLMYSTNGINWQSVSVDAIYWYSVVYGAGKFVAVSNTGSKQVIYSTDGITWSNAGVTGVGAYQWRSVTYGNGKFVAVGTSAAMSSSDGVAWARESSATGREWMDVTYGGDKFAAVSYSGPAMYNYTGTDDDEDITTLALTPTSKDLKYFNPGDKVTEAANFGTVHSVSTDELVLRDTVKPGYTNTNGLSNEFRGSAYGNGVFVNYSRLNNMVSISPDGITWEDAGPLSNQPWCLYFGDGRFFTGQFSGTEIYYSDDGRNWTPTTGVSGTYYGGCAYPGYAFAVGAASSIQCSTDRGKTWTKKSSSLPASIGFSNIHHYNGLLVLGSGSTVNFCYWSEDNGNSWTQGTTAGTNNSPPFTGYTDFAVNPNTGRWVSVGPSGGCFSDDGKAWTQSNPGLGSPETVQFFKGYFVVSENISNTSRVAISKDGEDWTEVPIPINSKLVYSSTSPDTLIFVPFSTTSSDPASVVYTFNPTGVPIVSDWTTSIGQGAEVDKSLSGTGTYASHTGSVLTVNNSNIEWVDSDNQRGEDFYATTQTTRLSLAKALEVKDYGVMEAKARAFPVAGPWSIDEEQEEEETSPSSSY